MKTIISVLPLFFLLFGCGDDENADQQKDMVTENATIFHYIGDVIFGSGGCDPVIETESNKIFFRIHQT